VPRPRASSRSARASRRGRSPHGEPDRTRRATAARGGAGSEAITHTTARNQVEQQSQTRDETSRDVDDDLRVAVITALRRAEPPRAPPRASRAATAPAPRRPRLRARSPSPSNPAKNLVLTPPFPQLNAATPQPRQPPLARSAPLSAPSCLTLLQTPLSPPAPTLLISTGSHQTRPTTNCILCREPPYSSRVGCGHEIHSGVHTAVATCDGSVSSKPARDRESGRTRLRDRIRPPRAGPPGRAGELSQAPRPNGRGAR
jgi:hypothetical protein